MMTNKNILFKYGIIGIFSLGLLLRITLFLKNPSLFYDETSLALNIINRTYSELFKGLDSLQVAPPFFLITTKFIYTIFSNQNDYLIDLSLRIIPFLSGVLVLPVFYRFISEISKDKKFIIAAIFVMTFNPLTINCCIQFKQYSLELLISILLLSMFYKILFKKQKLRYKYLIFISLAPWFSLSSFFIIASGFILLLLRHKTKSFLLLLTPFLISCILFYIFSLRNICAVNFSNMNKCWSGAYGFIDFHHPLRILIRLGDLFSYNKTLSIFLGGLLIFAITSFLFSKKDRIFKLFLLLPIILVFIASCLHLYPIAARLILFLFPIFVIFLSEQSFQYQKIFVPLFCLTTFILSIFYLPAPIVTSHRNAIKYLSDITSPSDTILIDLDFNTYKYYTIRNKPDGHIVQIPYVCSKASWQDSCKSFIKELPSGNYYLTIPAKISPKLVCNAKNTKTVFCKHSTIIYFEK